MPATRVILVALTAVVLTSCGGEDDQGARGRPQATVTQTDAQRGQASVRTVATGLEAPWELAFLPDGRALITERPGRVRLLSRDLKLKREPVARIDVAAVGEGGLLGLAIDPAFERNSFVYAYRTTDSGNEVVRYRFRGGRLIGETRILDGIRAAAIHNGGRLRFGPDGLLYVTTGEAGQPNLAQDDKSLNGKLLRLRGFRGGSARVEVVSKGHRNVQGLDWQPGTNRLVVTEFGPTSDDEVNVIRKGANYGWPDGNGQKPAINYEDVIAPSGATFLRAKSDWKGNFVFANLVGEQLRRVTLDGKTNEPLFRGEFGRLRTVTEGPDGALYLLTSNRDGRGSPSRGDDRVIRIEPPR